jgi:hypothetical protein
MTIQSTNIAIGPAPKERPNRYRGPLQNDPYIVLDLTGAIIAIRDGEPAVLVVNGEHPTGTGVDQLPSGWFMPGAHDSLDAGFRDCVRERTGLELGYAEQLCTFGASGGAVGDEQSRVVSIGYLALVLGSDGAVEPNCAWRSAYEYFPWEDWRNNRPAVLADEIEPHLRDWIQSRIAAGDSSALEQREQLVIAFGLDGARWDDERVLERYDFMWNAGLVAERKAAVGHHASATRPCFGRPMAGIHRRMLAAALGRLRAKIRYRPVVFELMQNEFTLFDLQRTVEAILGPHLHKQNFRRLVESIGLVEPTGDIRTHTGGRPAKLYRFRREVLLERPAPGVRVKSVARG